MTMTISKPDLPATKKQLWLLHLLTKEDTRNWNLTVKQASEKISELKVNSKPKSTRNKKRVKTNKREIDTSRFKDCLGYRLDIGGIHVVEAYKSVSPHSDNQISVSLNMRGIFPKGKKVKVITEWIMSNGNMILKPLHGFLANEPRIPENEYREYIKSLPCKINQYTHSKIPDDLQEKALELAKGVDRDIAIIPLS